MANFGSLLKKKPFYFGLWCTVSMTSCPRHHHQWQPSSISVGSTPLIPCTCSISRQFDRFPFDSLLLPTPSLNHVLATCTFYLWGCFQSFRTCSCNERILHSTAISREESCIPSPPIGNRILSIKENQSFFLRRNSVSKNSRTMGCTEKQNNFPLVETEQFSSCCRILLQTHP